MSKEAGKMNDTILEVKDLSVTFTQYERGFSRRTIHAVEKMDLTVKNGEIVAVVGSSGSGKSLLAHAIMGILPYNSEMNGEIWFLGERLTAERVKNLRGHEIVLVPQSVSYLDPLMKIGEQIQNGKKDESVKEKCLAVLKRYGLSPDIREKYPFQLSGGMTRRVLISTAVMEKPKLVIADEPTPGLHMEAATRVMGHFREMADEGAGVLLITHDLELALLTADRVIVLYGGRVVEETDAAAFQDERNLKHPYTKALFRSMPKNWKKDGEQLCDTGEILEDDAKGIWQMRLEARDISFKYGEGTRQILNHVTLTVEAGEKVGIMAPSGYGKTTLCKILAGYEKPDQGEVLLDGTPIHVFHGYSPVQMVWQHPELSVNPKRRLRTVTAEGDWSFEDPGERARIEAGLGIRDEWKDRFPVEVSGGELQRFCIARALGRRTKLLIADEMTTMLDLITQGQIWDFVLKELKRRDMGMIAVSHSPELLEKVCDRVVHLRTMN